MPPGTVEVRSYRDKYLFWLRLHTFTVEVGMPSARKPKATHDEWGSITPTPQGGWRVRYEDPDGGRREGGRFATKAEDAQLRTSIEGGPLRAGGSSSVPATATCRPPGLGRPRRTWADTRRTQLPISRDVAQAAKAIALGHELTRAAAANTASVDGQSCARRSST